MNEVEIIQLVKSYINQSIGGLDKENPKFDFKRSWYDLKTPKGINEFLKDTSAIANTFGPDGYIVIGFDDKTKVFYPANFKQSNLRDTSDIGDLINSKVDRLFSVNTFDIEIDGNSLSIIHIPPSIDKPHVIKRYVKIDKSEKEIIEENKIFVRRNTSCVIATKNDLELMYYDRKNITPEYSILANINSKSSIFNSNAVNRFSFLTALTLENNGRRPVAINFIKIKVSEYPDDSESKIKVLSSSDRFSARNLLLQTGQILNEEVEFVQDSNIHNMNDVAISNYFNGIKSVLHFWPLELHLANGEVIYADVKLVSNKFL